jgi:hypothetical protein
LKNLSETTADDTDNAGEDTPRNAPVSGVGKGVPPPRSTYAQGFWITERVASRLSGLTGVSAIFWRFSVANRRFKFKKRSQLPSARTIGMLPVAPMRISMSSSRAAFASGQRS